MCQITKIKNTTGLNWVPTKLVCPNTWETWEIKCEKPASWLNNKANTLLLETNHQCLSKVYIQHQPNAWNDLWCSDKSRKACYVNCCMCVKPSKESKDSVFWLAQTTVISHLFSNQTSFRMVRQTGCRSVNC